MLNSIPLGEKDLMKILVTGAAGFIGSAVCKKLTNEGHSVVGVDSYTDYYSVRLKRMRVASLLQDLNVQVFEWDLADLGATRKLFNQVQPDCVIHLSAQAGVRIPVHSYNKYTDSNLVGFSNVMQVTLENETPNFLYASSSSVYGNHAAIPYTEREKNLYPTSFYGATKLSNEILAGASLYGTETRSRGLRFFTVYGPWGRPDMMYFRILGNLLAGIPLELFGDGSVRRDFTFVDDVTKSIALLIEDLKDKEAGFSDVVNIGGGSPASILDLIKIAENLVGKKAAYSSLEKNKADVNQTMASTELLESLINWKPSISLENGMLKTVEWARRPEIESNLRNWISS